MPLFDAFPRKGWTVPRFLACALAFAALSLPGRAAIVDTPDCRRDLATADQLIAAIRQRESGIDNSVRKGDFAGACRYVRANYRDMSAAREQMNRCMTGFEKRENVGQLDASLDDIRHVLAARCQ